MRVVIQNPNTANADVASSQVIEDFKPIKTPQGQYIRGIEPTLTLDGMLMMFHKDTVLRYTYNGTPTNPNQWVNSRPFTHLYHERQTQLAGQSLEALYPIAREPASN
jgi:hypothetical protein